MNRNFNGNKGKRVTKHSGRVQAYILFLDDEGRDTYYELYGFRYNDKNPSHVQKMNAIYKSLSPEEFQEYKDRAALMNADPNVVRERRHHGEQQRRAFAHENPQKMHKLKEETNRGTKMQQERKRQANGPVFLPRPKGPGDPKILLDNDLDLMREKSRRTLREMFAFHQKNIYHREYNYIGVLNYSTLVDSSTASVIAFPAEIAIVKFKLSGGVMAHQQIKFAFNVRELIPDASVSCPEIEEILENQANASSEAYMLNSKRGRSITNVVPWLLDNLDPNEYVLMDAEQFAVQMESLTFIVNRLGTIDEVAAFERIKFHCIQDAGHAISMMNGSPVQLRKKEIEAYFSKNMVLKDGTHYCLDHARLADRTSYYYQELQMCPMHQALSKIQLFFEFCADFRVCGFTYRDVTEQHSPCSAFGETVPLSVTNVSLPAHLYLANLKSTLPAPVIEEKSQGRDDTLHLHTAQKLMEAVQLEDIPGPSRGHYGYREISPPHRSPPQGRYSPPRADPTLRQSDWHSPAGRFSQMSTRPVSPANSYVSQPSLNHRYGHQYRDDYRLLGERNRGCAMEFYTMPDHAWDSCLTLP